MLKDALEDFRRTIETNAARLHALSEAETRRARGEAGDGWTPKQIAGHLIDSASNNHGRVETKAKAAKGGVGRTFAALAEHQCAAVTRHARRLTSCLESP
ncbi:MAG TPA: hypothetical protein VGB76_07150 [Pyrinomonadaceae bacterium]